MKENIAKFPYRALQHMHWNVDLRGWVSSELCKSGGIEASPTAETKNIRCNIIKSRSKVHPSSAEALTEIFFFFAIWNKYTHAPYVQRDVEANTKKIYTFSNHLF